MKKARKGFSLIELLVVIGVGGLLYAMTMMGGAEANDIATANKIVKDFNVIASAMNMYYADNTAAAGVLKHTDDSTVDEEKIIAAIAAYMKSGAASYIVNAAEAGKYAVEISATDSSWWLIYTLSSGETNVAKILANKAVQEGLVTAVDSATTYVSGSGKTTVAMKVR